MQGERSARFNIKVDGEGNKIVAESSTKASHFFVHSWSGTGWVSIDQAADERPQEIFLRLHLGGPDELASAYDQKVIMLSISNTQRNSVQQ